MTLNDAIEIMRILGLTSERIVPVVVLGAIFLWILWKYFLSGIKKDVGEIKTEIGDLHNASKEIQMHLEKDSDGDWRPQHSLAQKPVYCYGITQSPTVSNDAGKKLLTDSKFIEQYPIFKQELFALMDVMSLRTPYDYELGSIKALEQLKTQPVIDPLKNYAVNHPNEPLDLIFKVASWVIRDDYDSYRKQKSE
ncbi:MAG: hypothetical protein AAB505_01230 [Patescibacteria group bacterium]